MRRRATGSKEEGTVLLLTVGLSVVLLLLVAVVVDVSAAILAKRALAGAVDGAAIAAAQQPDRAAINLSGTALDERLPLDPAAVGEVVAQYEADARGAQPGLDLRPHLEGASLAVVDGYRTVRLPFSGWLGAVSVRLHAVGRAGSPTTP